MIAETVADGFVLGVSPKNMTVCEVSERSQSKRDLSANRYVFTLDLSRCTMTYGHHNQH